MLLWIILLILCISLVACYVYTAPTVEKFVAFGFKSAPATSMYEKAGIEPCSILDNQTLTSQMYLGSLRFRKEKPAEAGKTQCYYFTDRDPAKTILQEEIPGRNLPPVADPLSAYSCSKKDNPIFQNVSFITGAKEVDTPDATLHPGISYKRCVINIDQSKVTPQEVSKFWAPLDVTNVSPQSLPCAATLASLQAETDMYNNRINQIQGEVSNLNTQISQLSSASNAFRRNFGIGNQTPGQLTTAASTCESRTKTLSGQLATSSNDYTNAVNAINREMQSSYALIDTYNSSINDIKRDIRSIQSQRAPVQRTVRFNENLNNELSRTYADLSQRNDDCGQKVLQGMQTLTTLRGQEVNIRNQRDRLLQDRANAREALKALKSINAELKTEDTTTAGRAEKAVSQAAACNRDLESATKEAQYWLDELEKVKAQLTACQNRLAPYQSQVSILTRKVEQLQGENPDLATDNNNLRNLIQDAAYKFAQIQTNTNNVNAQIANDACQRTTDLNMMALQIEASLVPYTKPRERVFLLPPCQDVIQNCPCPT
jgi:chromosome segregation ATPase